MTWLWILLVVIVPLFFNPLSRWQFFPDKLALMLMIAALIAGRSIHQGKLPSVLHWTTRALLFYVGVNLLSTLFSINPAMSFWGDPAWRNGFLMPLTGVGIFLFARIHHENRDQIITAALLTSGVVAGYGILQYMGFDPLHLREDIARIASTQAHANILALYLGLLLPFTLIRALENQRWFALLLIQGLALTFTYSRAGWLAASTGLLLALLLWLRSRGWKKVATSLIVAAILVFIILLILSFLPPLPSEAPYILQNLTNLFRASGATGQIRLYGWQAALEAWQAQPLTGYGLASYRTVLGWYFPPQLAPFGGAAVLDGRVHNRYLEILVESGFFGFSAYIAAMTALILPLLRQPLIPVIAMFAAYAVNSLFSFDDPASWTLLWLFAGLYQPQPAVELKPKPALGFMTVGAGIVAALFILIPDTFAGIAEGYCGRTFRCDRVTMLQTASNLNPVFLPFLSQELTIRNDWEKALAIDARLPSGVVESWRLTANHWTRRYHQTRNPEHAEQAFDAYTRALEISPRDPDLWLDRGLLATETGDLARAEADFAQVALLLPDYRRYYGAQSVLALAQSDYSAAEQWQQQAKQAQQEWDAWVWRR